MSNVEILNLECGEAIIGKSRFGDINTVAYAPDAELVKSEIERNKPAVAESKDKIKMYKAITKYYEMLCDASNVSKTHKEPSISAEGLKGEANLEARAEALRKAASIAGAGEHGRFLE